MELKERWDMILQSHQYPCFVADYKTYDLLYVNNEYLKLLGSSENIIGEKFFHVIPNDNVIDFEDVKLNWQVNEVIERRLVNSRMNIRFDVSLMLTKSEHAILGIMKPTDDSHVALSIFENAMTKCMEIFAQPDDTILLSFMKLLCDFYHCERAYVYRFNFDDDSINCVSQWCTDPDFQVTQEAGSKMNGKVLIEWLQTKNESGLVIADSEAENFEKDSVLDQILQAFNLKNLILCTIEDVNHQVVGAVGISNLTALTHYFDNRLINTISRFVAQDVSKVAIDETLFQLHYRDSLTGLYNRVGYTRHIERIKENPSKTLGVISININGLKEINENLGYEGGDNHIKLSSQVFKKHFGYNFFRISGDEFIGLAPDIEKTELEEKVVALHDKMKNEKNYDFSVGHSWGAGNYDYATLLREADTLMYINKQEYYHVTERNFDEIRDKVLSELLTFLADGEFMIYLQPQVRLVDGSLHGAEALIRRFDKKNQKMVFPDQFISFYEQKSVIRHVDLFVVDAVCSLLEEWGKVDKAIPISVNLSRVTLQEFGIVDTIKRICDKYAVPHHLLIIEVTERVGLIENNVASALIQEFKDNGFNISLDDFGCAYSNIVTLAQIKVDEVKIDKSLVDNLTTNQSNHILVKNVLTMCNELEGATTLAEGIEDENQAKILHDLGCHLGQGYFYSRPIPVEEFTKKYIETKEVVV